MTYLGVPSTATLSIVFIFLFSCYTPLQVSALKGHLQVEYTQSLMEAITPTADPFRLYDLYIYFIYIISRPKLEGSCSNCRKADGKSVIRFGVGSIFGFRAKILFKVITITVFPSLVCLFEEKAVLSVTENIYLRKHVRMYMYHTCMYSV
jgi:hypothetical protein